MNSTTASFRARYWPRWILANTLIGLFFSLAFGSLLIILFGYGFCQLIYALLQVWALRKSGLSLLRCGIASLLGLSLSGGICVFMSLALGPGKYEPDMQLVFFHSLLGCLWLGALMGAIIGGAQTIALFVDKSFSSAKKGFLLMWIPASILAFSLAMLVPFLLSWYSFGPAPLLTSSSYLSYVAFYALGGAIYGTVTVFPLAWIISKAGNASTLE